MGPHDGSRVHHAFRFAVPVLAFALLAPPAAAGDIGLPRRSPARRAPGVAKEQETDVTEVF